MSCEYWVVTLKYNKAIAVAKTRWVLTCFVFVVVNVVFIIRTAWFCGFPTSTTSSIKKIASM